MMSTAQWTRIVVTGLPRWSAGVVRLGMVQVDLAADRLGVREHVAHSAQVGAVPDRLRVLVTVDRDARAQVDDRSKGDSGVPQQLGQLVEEQRADLLHPRHAAGACVGAFECGLVQVDMHYRVTALRTVAPRLDFAGQQRDDVFGVGQPAQRDRAELIAATVLGQVGH